MFLTSLRASKARFFCGNIYVGLNLDLYDLATSESGRPPAWHFYFVIE